MNSGMRRKGSAKDSLCEIDLTTAIGMLRQKGEIVERQIYLCQQERSKYRNEKASIEDAIKQINMLDKKKHPNIYRALGRAFLLLDRNDVLAEQESELARQKKSIKRMDDSIKLVWDDYEDSKAVVRAMINNDKNSDKTYPPPPPPPPAAT